MDWLNSIFDFFKFVKDSITDFIENGISHIINVLMIKSLDFANWAYDTLITGFTSLVDEMGVNDIIGDYYNDIPDGVKDIFVYIGLPTCITMILTAYVTKFILVKVGVL
jgi:hypothetical protein